MKEKKELDEKEKEKYKEENNKLISSLKEQIKKNNTGEVKVDGKKWTAYADKNIKKGSIVKILKIDGVKVKVEEE